MHEGECTKVNAKYELVLMIPFGPIELNVTERLQE